MSYFSCINPQLRKFTTDRIRADDSEEKSAGQSGSPEIQRDLNEIHSNFITLLLMLSFNISPFVQNAHVN